MAFDFTNISVTSDIPVPCDEGIRTLIENLQVGQSFAIPHEVAAPVRQHIARVQRKTKASFTTRKFLENNVPMVRVWRSA